MSKIIPAKSGWLVETYKLEPGGRRLLWMPVIAWRIGDDNLPVAITLDGPSKNPVYKPSPEYFMERIREHELAGGLAEGVRR